MPPLITPLPAGASVEPVLRALPEWFGIEEALLRYVREAHEHPTFLAGVDSAPDAGFITLRRHFPGAAEVHCIAVRPEFHRRGVGHALMAFAEEHLREQGVRFLQVKTLGPSRPCPAYDRTRAFYLALDFVPLEEFPTLWPGNPALQLIKVL